MTKFYLFKTQLLVLLIIFISFLAYIVFSSALIFVISFLLLNLGFAYFLKILSDGRLSHFEVLLIS